MSVLTGVLLASMICYVAKLGGYLLPQRHLQHPLVARVAVMTTALLAALVAVNAATSGREVVADARLAAVAAAITALLLRAPFLLVVLAGAASAALTRLIL